MILWLTADGETFVRG